jgi:hypothetical protein
MGNGALEEAVRVGEDEDEEAGEVREAGEERITN